MSQEKSIVKDIRTITDDITDFDQYSVMVKQMEPLIKESIKETEKFQNTCSRMPIMDYIENFLPMHAGFVTEQDRYNMDDWLDFATSPFKEVHLINDKGEVVAIVPSMYPKDSYVLLNNEVNVDQGEIQHTLSQQLRDNKEVGMNYKALAERQYKDIMGETISRFDTKTIEEHKKKWVDFFTKMGLSPENIKNYLSSLENNSAFSPISVPTDTGNKEPTQEKPEVNPFILC